MFETHVVAKERLLVFSVITHGFFSESFSSDVLHFNKKYVNLQRFSNGINHQKST